MTKDVKYIVAIANGEGSLKDAFFVAKGVSREDAIHNMIEGLNNWDTYFYQIANEDVTNDVQELLDNHGLNWNHNENIMEIEEDVYSALLCKEFDFERD